MKLPWPRNPPLRVLMDGLGMRLKLFLYLGLLDLHQFFDKLKLRVDGLRVSLMRIMR